MGKPLEKSINAGLEWVLLEKFQSRRTEKSSYDIFKQHLLC